MKWISDRDPKSPGMYGLRYRHNFEHPQFILAYFDGEKWKTASGAEDLWDFTRNKEWSKIEWGEDKNE